MRRIGFKKAAILCNKNLFAHLLINVSVNFVNVSKFDENFQNNIYLGTACILQVYVMLSYVIVSS